jgi:hypothetical protein
MGAIDKQVQAAYWRLSMNGQCRAPRIPVRLSQGCLASLSESRSMSSMLRMAVKDALWQLPLRASNARRNFRCRGRERILIVQNSVKQRGVARDLFAWIERNVPTLFERLEFALLPCRAPTASRTRLVVLWGGDTLLDFAPWIFRQAVRMSDQCAELGIEVVNPATSWTAVSKSQTARILAGLGIRTPRVEPIADVGAFLDRTKAWDTPLLIREDRCHGQPSFFVTGPRDLARVPWSNFRRPVAIEFIDTRDPVDGLYRKYRYLAVDGVGLAHHLFVCPVWEVRGSRVKSDAVRAEECAFIYRPDPNHGPLQAARKSLGLGLAGFDYAYDRAGRLVVWEANPFPNVNYRQNAWSHHARAAQNRAFAAISRSYLRRAGWDIPALLDDMLAGMPDSG